MNHPRVAPHGTNTGIESEFLAPIHNAGLPIRLKSTDSLSYCAIVSDKYPHTDNFIIYRNPKPHDLPNDYIPLDVPAKEAARIMYNAYMHDIAQAMLDPNLKPEHLSIVWQEWINEVSTDYDAEPYQAPHLASTMYELGLLVLQHDRLKVLMSGFNAGQPEPEQWALFRPYLELCIQHPDRLGISLHEGKIGIGDLDWLSPVEDFYDFLIGRYQALLKYCHQEFAGQQPVLAISEWAWSYNKMPSYGQAIDEVDYVAKLAHQDQIDAVFFWQLSKGSQWKPLPSQMIGFLPTLATYVIETEFEEVEPPEPPPTEPPPPATIEQTIHLLPQDTTREELTAVSQYLHTTRSGFTYSADLAHVVWYGGTPSSLVVIWDGQRWPDNIYAWCDARQINYTKRSFSELDPIEPPIEPPPATGEARIGLHASTTPAISDRELEEFAILGAEVIKVLSFHEPVQVQRLAQQHPNKPFVVRTFLAMSENGQPRVKSPAEFYNETINDTIRTINHIGTGHNIVLELHNEPNLVSEGLGGSWFNGQSFKSWWLALLAQYKLAFPHASFAFPGLSPGGDVSGVRQDSWRFMQEASEAVTAADALAVHLYWADNAPMANALAYLDRVIAEWPGKPIWVTEASNNKPAPAEQVAQEYVAFWQELKRRPQVRGVTYFVASDAHGDYPHESWLPRNMASLVAARMP